MWRRALALSSLSAISACKEPLQVHPISVTVELWDGQGSGYCRDSESMWADYSAADVSTSRAPGEVGPGGICVVPVDPSRELFVLEQVTCTSRREDDEARVQLSIEAGELVAPVILTAESPTTSVGFGRGWASPNNVGIDVVAARYNVQCAVQGYYAYARKAAGDGERPDIDPFTRNVALVERRPEAPK